MNRELIDSVKQAMREMEREKFHEQVHQKARSMMSRKLNPGEIGRVQCGLCDEIITMVRPKEVEEI